MAASFNVKMPKFRLISNVVAVFINFAIIKYYRLGGLNNRNLFSYNAGV
jgi:hypothetical protein